MNKANALREDKTNDYPDLQHFSFPPSFFEDEVREGFFISNMMKSYWALQIHVLSEIDAVCKRHDIRWFLDSGNLLGAVRHGGFIPWDDDLDIVMFRHELDAFLEYAKLELPKQFSIYDNREKTTHESIVIRIINTSDLSTLTEDLEENLGCPYAAGVDILVLDGVYDDQEKELARMEELFRIYHIVSYIEKGEQDTEACRNEIKDVEKEYGIVFDPDLSLKGQLYRLAIQIYSRVSSKGAHVLEVFFGVGEVYLFPSESFQSVLMMPFEGIMMPVPHDYDTVLRVYYGEYTTPVRNMAAHKYPAYKLLEKQLEEALGGIHPLRYTFKKEHLFLPKQGSPEEQINRVTALLQQAKLQLEQMLASGEAGTVVGLSEGINRLVKKLEKLLAGRRETVFLVFRASAWPAMEAAYREARENGSRSVHVIPIPWYEKNTDGSTGKKHDERDLFPQDVELTMPEDYDLSAHMPAEIFTGFPYDDTNRCITLDPAYHTVNIRNMTDHLVYIPYLSPDTPGKNDGAGRAALEVFIEQPAVVFADEVRLETEGMCRLYTDVMTRIAGEDTRSIWEQKIRSER